MVSVFGVVLTGGGARGAYEVGAWKCIRKERLKIGAICGTSVGSINGAVFAQGDYKLAEKLWSEMKLSDVVKLGDVNNDKLTVKNIQNAVNEFKMNNGLSMEPFEELLKDVINEDKLMLSPIDFGLVTYSVTERKAIEIFKADIPRGEVVDYIMASACLPGVKRKVIDNREYIDGGFGDNKPVGMLIGKGYRDIIVVDVGGYGVEKQVTKNGVNIIEIKCSSPKLGIMEFNKEKITDSINCGYVDARRAFGRVCGERYAIESKDYLKAKKTMSDELISGLESSADFLGVYKYREYSFQELMEAVRDKYNRIKCENTNVGIEALVGAENKQILFVKACEAIKSGNMEGAGYAVNILMKDFARAVNALRYYSI